MWNCYNNRLEGNDVKTSHIGGISLVGADNSVLIDNIITDSTNVGISIYQSQNAQLLNNEICCSGLQGVLIQESHNGKLDGNTINDESVGFSLLNSGDCNHIFIDGTYSRNTIYDNILNFVYENQNINKWNSHIINEENIVGGPKIGGNYWIRYTGVDQNDDGFGDIEYSILSNNKDNYPLVCNLVVVNDTYLPISFIDEHFEDILNVKNGIPPFQWEIVDSLNTYFPENVNLTPLISDDRYCLLSGNSSSAVEFTFVVKVTDAINNQIEKQFVKKITIVSPLRIITNATLPTSNPNEDFTNYMMGSGGNTPYQWSLIQENLFPLPTGVNFLSNDDGMIGIIQGQTSVNGEFKFLLRLEDSSLNFVDKAFVKNIGQSKQTYEKNPSSIVFSTLGVVFTIICFIFCVVIFIFIGIIIYTTLGKRKRIKPIGSGRSDKVNRLKNASRSFTSLLSQVKELELEEEID